MAWHRVQVRQEARQVFWTTHAANVRRFAARKGRVNGNFHTHYVNILTVTHITYGVALYIAIKI